MDGPPPPRQTRGPAMEGCQSGFFAVATILVAIRLYVRLYMRRGPGWDDFWIVISWAIALLITVAIALDVKAGFGQHLYYVEDNTRNILYYSTMAEIANPLGIATVKLSVIAFVLRLIGRTMSKIRYICYVNLVLFVPMTLALFFILCFQCTPLHVAWDEVFPRDKCVNRQIVANINTAQASLGAASDILTAILPAVIISGLQMDRKRKIGLCVLTGLGCVVSVFGILKGVTGATSFSNPDSTWALCEVSIYAALEHEVGLTVACIPACMPFFGAAKEQLASGFSKLRAITTGRSGRTGSLTSTDDMELGSAGAKFDSKWPAGAASKPVSASRRFNDRFVGRMKAASPKIRSAASGSASGSGSGGSNATKSWAGESDEGKDLEIGVTRVIEVNQEAGLARHDAAEEARRREAGLPWCGPKASLETTIS